MKPQYTVTYFAFNSVLCRNSWQIELHKQLRPVKGEILHFGDLVVEIQRVGRNIDTGEHFAFCMAKSGLKELESHEQNPLKKDGWEKKEVPEKIFKVHHH